MFSEQANSSRMDNDSYWFGWIPILTNEILIDYYIVNLRETATKLTGEDKKRIDGILSKDGLYYKWVKESDESPTNIASIVVSIGDNNKVDDILIFDEQGQLKVHSLCTVENDGIVKINLLFPKKNYESKIVAQCYIIVRDVYHSHTHHYKHEDLLLSPVKANERKEASHKILKQYLTKIPEYHKKIRKSIEIEEKIDQTATLITKAKGEMLYALSFINLFKSDIDNSQSLNFIFSNAHASIEVLSKEIEVYYSSKTNEQMTQIANKTKNLTIWLLIVTIVLAVLTIFLYVK